MGEEVLPRAEMKARIREFLYAQLSQGQAIQHLLTPGIKNLFYNKKTEETLYFFLLLILSNLV